MRDTLLSLCESFIENRDAVKSAFGWESTYIYPVCAAIFTDKRARADESQMKSCRDILRNRTGVFSNFRGNAKLAVISMLAVSEDPEEKLGKALQVYEELKGYFFTSQYLPVASMIIADMADPSRYGEIAERTRHIYNLMKKEHPFLTSGEDSVFAALLALSKLSDDQVVEETEACYEILKPEFFSSNAVQSLSHVLALGDGTSEEKCRKTMELFYGLKEKGRRYGTSYELATLGVLALIPAGLDSIIEDVVEVDEFLAQQKGYGIFGPGKKQRLMHAAMLVSSDYIGQADQLPMSAAAVGSTLSLIAAQQAAMCAAVAASSAAAANSSTN